MPPPNGVRFAIKHKSSGVIWAPQDTSKDDPDNGSPILTRSIRNRRAQWEFVHVENEWGYIKHATSANYYVHPSGDKMNPEKYTDLVIWPGKNAADLFALDARRGLIIHKSGKLATPFNLEVAMGNVFNGGFYFNTANPPTGTPISLIDDVVSDGNKWLFVDYRTGREVEIYDKPIMTGYWRPIFTALNPRVDRTETKTITVGKSNSSETTSSFKFTWEASAGFSIGSFDFGTSLSTEKMFSATSSQTWQTTETRQISVKGGGPSVVVWQYVFDCNQYGRRSEFTSNIIVDTDSLNRKPNISLTSTGSTSC